MERAPDDPEVLREGIADMLRMDLRAHLACIASIGDPAVTHALGSIRAPTLLVGGRQDRVVPPSDVAAAHDLAPNSRLAWLENCGHMPTIERPLAYHQALRDFLLDEHERSR
jgi:pimeloyl-ACP methyl ester carboxylesterase